MADPAVIALDVLQSSVVLLCASPTPSSLLPLTFTTQCCQTRKCFSFFFFFFKSLRAKLLAGILIDFLRQCLLSTFLAAVLGPGQLAELVVGVCWRLHTEKSTQDGELAVTTR